MTAAPTTAGTMFGESCADPRRQAAARRTGQLAERKGEVALALGRGGANAEIAAALRMGVPTVTTHVSRAPAEPGLGNRVRIALLVHDAGLLDQDGDVG